MQSPIQYENAGFPLDSGDRHPILTTLLVSLSTVSEIRSRMAGMVCVAPRGRLTLAQNSG